MRGFPWLIKGHGFCRWVMVFQIWSADGDRHFSQNDQKLCIFGTKYWGNKQNSEGISPTFSWLGYSFRGNLLDGSWLSRDGEMDFKAEGPLNTEKYCRPP